MAIRLATAADGAAIAEIYRPAVTHRATSFELEPPDGDEMGRRVTTVTLRTPWLVYERAGDVIGYAYAGTHRERAAYQWSVETSAYVRDGVHRGGVGRALYATLFAVLERQGFVNAYAGTTLPNPASEAFHRSLGFTFVGVYHGIGYKFGQWHDVAWYERAILPRVLDQPLPTPLPELADSTLAQSLERNFPTGNP